jgi:hypothetical protein
MLVFAWDQEPLPAWFGSGSDWLQLVSRCGFVYVVRTHRAMSASLPRVIARGWQRPTFESPRSPVGSPWGVVRVVDGSCES